VESLAALPAGKPKSLPKVQHHFGPESAADRDIRLSRRQQIKAAFKRCWESYRAKAWMRDELSPISGGGRNSFGGWAATLVDALDILWIMELKDEFYEAAAASTAVDFTTSTDDTVNIFETTIQYLGGFLAAYDLSGEEQLLHKAVEVGEMLLVAFDTPNHMPITRWEWKKAANGDKQTAPGWMLVSELGSLSLEFTRLSQLTGDQRWYDAIDRITKLFDTLQQKTKLPGMWPVVVNPKDEDLTGDTGFTLGGMSDSLYEYFPKEFMLLGGLSPVYQKLHEQSMSTALEHLIFRPMVPQNDDILMSGDARANDDGSSVLEPRVQHLGCFAGGMFGLGGRLFSNEEHVIVGEKLTKGCI
jgi:mannosyl-oligosaccharide alpha-1,2-mannosidase